MAQAATLPICIRKTFAPGLCRDTNHPEVILAFPQFPQANDCIVPRIRTLMLHSLPLFLTQSFDAMQTEPLYDFFFVISACNGNAFDQIFGRFRLIQALEFKSKILRTVKGFHLRLRCVQVPIKTGFAAFRNL